ALGAALVEETSIFKNEMISLESAYRTELVNASGPSSTSILWLLKSVGKHAEPMTKLAELASGLLAVLEYGGRQAACAVLSKLYEALLSAQDRAPAPVLQMHFRLFVSCLTPYMDLVGKSFSSALETDPFHELFLLG
ncbi:hypothetical protein HDU91_003774, partial [Kappamyces sp. JEL0680]